MSSLAHSFRLTSVHQADQHSWHWKSTGSIMCSKNTTIILVSLLNYYPCHDHLPFCLCHLSHSNFKIWHPHTLQLVQTTYLFVYWRTVQRSSKMSSQTSSTPLSQVVVTTCFKATNIIPVTKKSPPSCFNDYCPVALTSVSMKCFEWLVMRHIKSIFPPCLDPLQFVIWDKLLHWWCNIICPPPSPTHLDLKGLYVRMLFMDFRSAFNTIIPQQIILKLDRLRVNTYLCNWLLDFFIGRSQAVRVGTNTSSTIMLTQGVHQGCVLSSQLSGTNQQQLRDKLHEGGKPPGQVV